MQEKKKTEEVHTSVDFLITQSHLLAYRLRTLKFN
jgi:hypothetical protein